MNRRSSIFRAIFVGLAAGMALASGADCFARVSEWKNRDGVEMSAELIGYDLEEKKVQFRKADETTYSYPLEELDLNGKVAVVSDDRFSGWLKEQGWEQPPVVDMISTVGTVFFLSLAVYLALVFLIQWLCFWFSARVVTGESGLRLHLFGWLKAVVSSMVAQMVCFILMVLLGIVLAAFASNASTSILAVADPSPAITVVSCCFQGILLVVGIAVPAWFVADHYELGSIWSGAGIIVLGNILTTIVLLVVVAVLFFLAREHGDMIFTDWLLRPLKLV